MPPECFACSPDANIKSSPASAWSDQTSKTCVPKLLRSILHALSDADIRNYIASGEPMDKAGAYAIQGAASRWISKIEGDYSNVVGLPIALVLQMLREHRVIES